MSDDLARFRPYLLALARQHLAGRAGPDPSDVVQDTLLDAACDLARFRGPTDAERAALVHNLADRQKHDLREKRDIRRERSLELDELSCRLGGLIAGRSPEAVAGLLKRGLQGLREGLA